MSALDPADMRKLRASLARLASPHDGEIVAAAKAAERILGKRGLGFSDLTIAQALPPPRREPPRRRDVRSGHQRRARMLLSSGYAWNDWARKFLKSIQGWSAALSEKQAEILRGMEREAEAHFAGGGAHGEC